MCHCNHCQKDTGSAHAANLFSKTANLKWISGAEKVKTFNLPNTRHHKSFCTDCGSAMPTLQMAGQLLVVPAGCLDTEINIKPSGHIFMSSKANWSLDLESVQRFEKYPKS